MKADDLNAHFLAERRQNLAAARAFFEACRTGSAETLYEAVDQLNMTVDGWHKAMTMVGRMPSVGDDIRRAFLTVWVESKSLALKIGERSTVAKALRVLLPGVRPDSPMILYRGTSAGERRRHIYGFSWTTRLDIARDKFADMRRSSVGGAVVLKTIAPPNAILLVRAAENYYDEGEVIVDPYKLGSVELVQRLSPLIAS